MRRDKRTPKPEKPTRSLTHLSARWNVEKPPLKGQGPPANSWLWRARAGLGEWYVRRRAAGLIAAVLIGLLLIVVVLLLRYSSEIFRWIAAEFNRFEGP